VQRKERNRGGRKNVDPMEKSESKQLLLPSFIHLGIAIGLLLLFY
jgi:hypothetical protein